MYKHIETYLISYKGMLTIVYGSGHADFPSHCEWVVVWPQGYWD